MVGVKLFLLRTSRKCVCVKDLSVKPEWTRVKRAQSEPQILKTSRPWEPGTRQRASCVNCKQGIPVNYGQSANRLNENAPFLVFLNPKHPIAEQSIFDGVLPDFSAVKCKHPLVIASKPVEATGI